MEIESGGRRFKMEEEDSGSGSVSVCGAVQLCCGCFFVAVDFAAVNVLLLSCVGKHCFFC